LCGLGFGGRHTGSRCNVIAALRHGARKAMQKYLVVIDDQ